MFSAYQQLYICLEIPKLSTKARNLGLLVHSRTITKAVIIKYKQKTGNKPSKNRAIKNRVRKNRMRKNRVIKNSVRENRKETDYYCFRND